MKAAAARLARWRLRPIDMVREEFGVEPDVWQADVLAAFANPDVQRIAMKACKGPGKTAAEAWCILNFLGTRPSPKIICTSITEGNLNTNLWPELSKWMMRSEFFRGDRSMAWMLSAVIIALLIVTALGIVGLASFWVQQRTRQIGVRRALGATKGQILRYFQTENFLLATLGIVLGMMLAYGINQLLMGKYELPRLPAIYLPIGAIALWLLGQVSVLGPARRAAAVPPAVATRSV